MFTLNMFLKKSLRLLKEKIYVLLLAELAFFFLTFFFTVFARNKLAAYIAQLQGFANNAAGIPQGASQAQVAQFLDQFQSLTNEAMFFIYVIIPLVLFIIWCATQSIVWKTVKEKTIKSFKSFFWKFCVISAIALVFILLILMIPITFSIFDEIDTLILKGVLLFVLFFVTHAALTRLGNESFLTTLKHTGKMLKRPHRIILPFIIYLVVLCLVLYLLSSLFVTYTKGIDFLLPLTPLTLYLIVGIVLLIWTKIVFQIKVDEVARK